MSSFPIDPDRLQRLAATRGGRVALGGFEYQRAFALLRLASMAVGQTVKGSATEVPALLRYEWAEDVDELDAHGRVTLWQCKLGDGWTAPLALAGLLAGFAPKWLWTPQAERNRLQFRLVTSDPSYAANADLPGPLPAEAKVRGTFLSNLATPPSDASDRAQWQAEADAVGHGALFDALWGATQVLFVPARSALPAPARWPAEDEALSVLAKAHRLAPGTENDQVVQALRALLGVDPPAPDADRQVPRQAMAPLWLRPIDAADRLHPFRPRPADLNVLLQLVDGPQLRAWRAKPPSGRYVARRPEWPDVVHGANDQIGFFERTLTDHLVAVLRQALTDSLQRSSRLRLQWLVGAPGAGKSTLALRAAARLVEAGAASVVDARFALDEDDDISVLAAELNRLAEGPRPLLLLLDDPLSVGSRWPALLQALSRARPAMVVLAATPDFLLRSHQHELRDVAPLTPVELERPDADERVALARLYPSLDASALLSADEELLVLTMQAAANANFDDIIRGQWHTLAGGRTLPDDTLARSLPWEVAAFWLVVFFHRAYAACPLSLLEGVLDARPDGIDIGERLAGLADANGWHIFQVEVPRGRFAYQGTLVRAMHARVAQRAWDGRPARHWAVADAIARASLRQPTMTRRLAEALVALRMYDAAAADPVIAAVARIWAGPDAAGLETRYLCDIVTVWSMSGVQVPHGLSEAQLKRANRCDSQSWLAALSLLYAQSRGQPTHATLELPYDALIDAADFSVAPNRAGKFANALSALPAQRRRFVQRLWQVFDRQGGWQLNNTLLSWLLARGEADNIYLRVSAIRAWLAAHDDATSVRTVFLTHLPRLDADAQRAMLKDYRDWLAAHPSDTEVRGAFLNHLPRLDANGQHVMLKDYRDWLAAHPSDTGVRKAFLACLNTLAIPAGDEDIDDAMAHLDRTPSDTNVRAALLSMLASQRHSALPQLLARSLDEISSLTRSFTTASAALVAAATLDGAHLVLITRWLDWAAETLENFATNRAAQIVVTSLATLVAAAERHASESACLPNDRKAVEAAIRRACAAQAAWMSATRVPTQRYL